MRCRDAKHWLTAQRDTDLVMGKQHSESVQLQEHVQQCSGCHTFERRQQRLDNLLQPSPPRVYPGISTERIMHAVERQKRITQQLENIQAQQQARLARMSKAGPKIAGIVFLVTGMLTIGLLSLFIFQPDIFVTMLSSLSGVIDVLFLLTQYLQAGLALITRENWLLSGVALVLVVMMGLWLRLMRYPQEA
jgi:hypothetical protein